MSEAPRSTSWTFLTNHTHVLLCLAHDPTIRMREIAAAVGITERAVQRIISELHQAGYIERSREGRRNEYSINRDMHLRHSLEEQCRIGELLELLQHSEDTTA